jgi:hypothetical protein
VAIPPGYIDYDSNKEMLDIQEEEPPTIITALPITDGEKRRLIKKWRKHKQSYIRKKRTKSSHVY